MDDTFTMETVITDLLSTSVSLVLLPEVNVTAKCSLFVSYTVCCLYLTIFIRWFSFTVFIPSFPRQSSVLKTCIIYNTHHVCTFFFWWETCTILKFACAIGWRCVFVKCDGFFFYGACQFIGPATFLVYFPVLRSKFCVALNSVCLFLGFMFVKENCV